jgi:hypothetical protein
MLSTEGIALAKKTRPNLHHQAGQARYAEVLVKPCKNHIHFTSVNSPVAQKQTTGATTALRQPNLS